MEQINQEPQYQPNQVPRTNQTFWPALVFSIVQIIFVPGFYGVIPLIITLMANSDWKNGNFEAYNSKTKAAKIFLIVGAVLLVIWVIVVLGGFGYLFLSLVNSGF